MRLQNRFLTRPLGTYVTYDVAFNADMSERKSPLGIFGVLNNP